MFRRLRHRASGGRRASRPVGTSASASGSVSAQPLALDQARAYLATQRRSSGRPRSLGSVILQLDGSFADRQVRGWGELPLEASPHPVDPQSLAEGLDQRLARLEGWTFPLGSLTPSSLLGVSDRASTPDAAQPAGPEAFRSHGEAGWLEPALDALTETALIDLLGKAVDQPAGALLGGKRRHLALKWRTVSASRDAGVLEARARRSAERGFAPRFRDLATPDDAEMALHVLARLDALTPQTSPWLVFDGSLDDDEAEEVTQCAVRMLELGILAAPIIIEAPLNATDPAPWTSLQSIVDAGEERTPPVVIMIGGEPAASMTAQEILATGCNGVSLDLYRLGGPLRQTRLVRELQRERQDLQFGIAIPEGGSGLTAATVVEAASTLWNVGYLALSRSSFSGPAVAERPRGVLRNQRLRAGRGSGLGVEAHVAPIVHQVQRTWDSSDGQPDHKAAGENHYEEPMLDQFRRGRALESHLLERAALSIGLTTVRFSPVTFVASHPHMRRRIGFYWTSSTGTGVAAREVATDKQRTRAVLEHAAVPVARGRAFCAGDDAEALEFAATFEGLTVVKPRYGRAGKGVSTHLATPDAVARAIRSLRGTEFSDQDFVVEEHVEGADYRFLVVGDQVVSAVLRRPAAVRGDGISTVTELALRANLVRAQNPHLRPRKIHLGDDASFQLERQGLGLDSVPRYGEEVRLSSAANISRGGNSVEILDETHPSLVEIAVRASSAVAGLDHCGVDLLIEDHRRPATDQRIAVCELNATPALGMHAFPMFGPPRDVATHIVRRSCEREGYNPTVERSRLTVDVRISGDVQGKGFRQWVRDRARSAGVSGWIQNLEGGDVVGRLDGPARGVSALVARAAVGPRGASPDRVVASPLDAEAIPAGFEIR